MRPSILLEDAVISSMMDSVARSTTRARKTSASSKMCEREWRPLGSLGPAATLMRQSSRMTASERETSSTSTVISSLYRLARMRCAEVSGASQTMVMREVSARSDSPTVSETMLMLRRRKSEAPGHPMLYGTTQKFLEHFGLRDIDDM